MGTLILLAALSCPDVVLINQNKEPWNDFDAKVIESARARCIEIYPDAPCLKKFYKRPTEQSYWAICGKENNSN